MGIDKELLAIMVCPKCKGKIYVSGSEEGLVCDACRLLYPIVDDIPVMLVEEARNLSS